MSQLYLIPKSEEWEYILSNARPIALLESFRKCVTRILNKRLAKVFVENEILKGPNFAGLPDCSTENPIHIMNMLMEDAKEKGKEMWILFQNMRKAFDSVSLVSLELAMYRLKLPKRVVQMVLNLFEKRKARVITAVGTTDPCEASDGIDQGEVLSPLLWRIFYDPLLCYMADKEDIGYEIKVEETTDWARQSHKQQKIKFSVLAYADDTT